MTDVIQLLPDSVANQIAAGEVVQRPASVVKELMENAIDAGATRIEVILKNAGKSLIQVIDNGKGMSPRDARMAFERHATSKISSARDLFNIRTMGFRGEALASIASVAEVELKTKREADELGTSLFIADSQLKSQESIQCNDGTNMAVKNLFFTIPARRKFLKSDTTELRNITTEFLRVALTQPEISFRLVNNNSDIYNLPASGLRQRIVNAFGKSLNARMIPIQCETGLINIHGFICTPQQAKKSYGEQFFFVNNRFMRHSFFHKAVTEAYSGLIAPDTIPSYFLYFTVDPSTIDINIHPTKTEIKFQDEGAIFQIILASTKESLGKFNVMPSIDFDTEDKIDFPVPGESDLPPKVPGISYNPNYNPFNYRSSLSPSESDFEAGAPKSSATGKDQYGSGYPEEGFRQGGGSFHRETVPANWEVLFQGLEEEKERQQPELPGMMERQEHTGIISFFQVKGKYIVTPVHSGLMFIDQKRAQERILFERYCESLSQQRICGQKSLFPEELELSAEEYMLVQELLHDLSYLGFELKECGENTLAIHTTPPDLTHANGRQVLLQLIGHYKNTEGSIREKMKERLALSMAQSAAFGYHTVLSREEMQELFDSLFACHHPNYTADGKTIIHILTDKEIGQWF